MHKFSDGIQTILKAVSHCAKINDVKVFLHGDLALYAITGKTELLHQNIDIVLSYESEFETNKLYQCLVERIAISQEVENSPLKYQFISDAYNIQIDLIAQFNPTIKSNVQRFGRFNLDLLFLDLFSEEIKHLPGIDSSGLHNISPPATWTFEDVLGFVEWKGRFPDLKIPSEEYDYLRTISLGTLKESLDIGWNEQIQNILLSHHSGSALKFMTNVFVDGMAWSFKVLVDYMISMNVGINEDANIETVFNDKKFELIDLYNEFFLNDKKTVETYEEAHHRLNTILKLVFDSPDLDIPRPYTNFVQAMGETDPILSSNWCPSGDCLDCTPSDCEGPQCCCCVSIDITRDIRARCYDRVYFSCNKDGTGPEEGETFDAGCTKCFEACDFALEEEGNTCGDISGHGENTSPPNWWGWTGQGKGPCTCECAELTDPNNPASDCNLTCVKCNGLTCNANVAVTASSCNYQFNLSPGLGCCGTPTTVDIVFVISYAFNMSPYIADVKNSAQDLADTLSATGAEVRFGLVVFGRTRDGTQIDEQIFSNGQILTTSVSEFRAGLDVFDVASGGEESSFDAVELPLFTYPWDGGENIIFLIGTASHSVPAVVPIGGALGDSRSQPSVGLLIDLANDLGVTVHVIQPFGPFPFDLRKTDLALGTNGQDLDIAIDFSTLLDDLNFNVFGASCTCLDTTPVPVILCPGGDCSENITDIPIRKCVEENNSDCNCNEPLTFDICGEIVVVQPDPETLNLICCGDIEGGGCECSTVDVPPADCCGLSCSDVSSHFCDDTFATVEDAINAIWCECWNNAASVVTHLCIGCEIPELTNENSETVNAITNCEININDGLGGFTLISRSAIATEVTAAWAACEGPGPVIIPPSVSEASCLPECNRTDQNIGTNIGCTSVRNPATAILNNGIGLVAYESMIDTSVIKIDQFNTSLPAKILPNRRTNYGRLEHELKWKDSSSSDVETGTKVVKLYYFEDVATHFINGVSGLPETGSLTDTIVFQNGPLQNQCFSLHLGDGTEDPTPLGEDSIGKFIQFTIKTGYTLSNPFPSLDDVYDIEWFIIDSDDTGLTGSVGDVASADTPGFDFLLGGADKVNAVLRLDPHVHDGIAVPIAYPSLAAAHNYMNAENSHFVYLVYQALEDSKWNVYMRQLRLSEYSKDKQITGAEDNSSFVSLSSLGVDELTYRVICTNDDCSLFGNDFIAKRTVTLEITLPDGREVFNEAFVTNNSTESWNICSGLPSGDVSKKKVFAEMSHSAIVNRCPDQFEFNDIFYNWDVGDEFSVPFTTLNASDLFVLLRKPNDSSIEISEDPQTVSGIVISSSQVGAVWYDAAIVSWVAIDSASFQDLLKYKGLDVSAPIPLTEFEIGHCTHPVVKINSNNEVYVVYECTNPSLHQIHIVGTAIPTSAFPLGIFSPKNIDANLDYFLAPDDFVYRSDITSSQRMNQLPDMHIDVNDIIHIAWQSNRDNYWEIYYAKSDTSFTQKRITDYKSKSLKPSIHGDDRGNVHIAWHDNRFGNWEILMAHRDEERPLTLLEQDPYLAGVRNEGYQHFTDAVPFVMTNTTNVAVCYSNLSISFFTDRLLTQRAFEVTQSDFPIAFQIPGAQDDRSTIDLVYADLVEWTSVAGTSILGNPVNIFSPPDVFDTLLVGSELETVSMIFDGVQPQDIRFTAGESINTTDPSWVGTGRRNVSNVASGEESFFFRGGIRRGRYKKLEVSLPIGDDLTNISKITIVSIVPDRFCIPPNSSLTGFLDLTPAIRVDKEGNEVIETPIPVEARKNIVYFISALGVQGDGSLTAFDDQKRSVSCETCVANTEPWESSSCTFSFEFNNTASTSVFSSFFNARIRFYADQGKQDLVAQFDAFQDGQLECFTTDDNRSAQSVWQTAGYEVFPEKRKTITLWPLLVNTTGLLCGIKYWVETEICSGLFFENTPFSDFNSPCSRTDLTSVSLNSWVCDCASPRWSEQFGSAPVNIRDIVKWNSSGDGFSDTRLTETGISVNNYNPQIRIRSDLTGLVLFETDRDDEHKADNENHIHSIYASAFRVFPSSNMYASGAESITTFGEVLVQSDIPITPCSGADCGDCNNSTSDCQGVGISGRNVAFSLDQYDNIFLATEQQDSQDVCEEFTQNKQQSILVHRCGVYAKNLAFIPEEGGGGAGEGATEVPSTEILGKAAPLIQDKTFRQIIKMARVSNKSAKYHITRLKKPAAVVDQCGIFIEIVTEPDTVSVRLKNETGGWSVWYPFDPEIGEYTMVVPWTLSPVSGTKSVTIEAATYQGLAASFSLIIIADYKGIDNTIEFLKSKNSDIPPIGSISNDTLISLLVTIDNSGMQTPTAKATEIFSDANKDVNRLSQLDDVPVAGIRKPTVEGGEIVNETAEYIYIEIAVPQSYLDMIKNDDETIDTAKNPSFDVLQQGEEDLFSLPTVFDEASNKFRGVFPIKKDNNAFSKDGLSFVIMHFFNDCSDLVAEDTAEGSYIRDRFNIPTIQGTSKSSESLSPEDIWANDRSEIGEILHKIDIRGKEDPYFVFGNPNYRLKKRDE